MFRRFFVLSVICFYLGNNVSALLTTCPVTSDTTPSIPLDTSNILLGQPYPGKMTLKSDGTFEWRTIDQNSGNTLTNSIGTWSSSSNILTITATKTDVLQGVAFTITALTCSYTCGSSGNSPAGTCNTNYKAGQDYNTGTFTSALDLTLSAASK